ncbi:hypothetical protein [Providencia sp. PROV130]|uniref:hypothetical protein n=1 Tax=Providencia sp. PROV130 TaxID=2949840 RepID=UPI00234A3DA0|nr:hypothetical protein [Providencia sp. PROV130]
MAKFHAKFNYNLIGLLAIIILFIFSAGYCDFIKQRIVCSSFIASLLIIAHIIYMSWMFTDSTKKILATINRLIIMSTACFSVYYFAIFEETFNMNNFINSLEPSVYFALLVILSVNTVINFVIDLKENLKPKTQSE